MNGCGNSTSPLPWTTQDSWYRTSAGDDGSAGANEFILIDFREVTSATEMKAETMLKDKPIVPLTLAQAGEFSGGKYVAVKGKRPMLVRSVYLNKETGKLSVFLHGKKLIVSHDSLGSSLVPMQRQALIVSLAAVPTTVAVICGMAD